MRCLITSRTVGFLRRPAHRLPGNPEKQISMRVSEGANDLEKPAELHLQYLPEAPDALANGQSNAVVNSVGALQYFISKRQPTNRNCNLGPVLSRARATSACRRPRVNLEFVPRAPNRGRFTNPELAFTFADLTDWSRHEPAVTLRAQTVQRNASAIVPPIGARAANLADSDVLAYQGITRGGVTAEQRLGEIRAALAEKPTPNETAIEIPARLTLSTAQEAIWFEGENCLGRSSTSKPVRCRRSPR
jgi:hypothetical protein